MNYIEEEVAKFNAFLGIEYPYEPPLPDWETVPNQEKILVLSDPHEPYAHQGIFNYVADRERDAATVIVPGDVGDYFSKSKFRKTHHVSFKDELRSVFHRLAWLSSRWHTVLVMLGNHDNRPEKKLADLLSDNVELQLLTESNLLKRMASYFDNVHVVGQQLDGTPLQLTHLYQHHDIIFTHGELSRVQKTATLEYISRYLKAWAPMLGLKPYRVIAQGHNHQDLKCSYGDERWLMLPTCSDIFSTGFEYIWSNPRMIGRPPSQGWTVIYQKNGVTNWNKSHNFVLDNGSPR